MKKKLPLITAFVLAVSLTALGQTDSTALKSTVPSDSIQTDYSSMSLEELMNMSVSVSSKKDEKLADAPGSITAYSDKDIEKLGYYTLGGLADITAGYSSFKGIGETTFETRGQKQDGFDNNKHLVLIDGIPFNHVRSNMALGEENLPLFFAKRVEFLKGPGSALYGTSAFSGVISVVSKDLEENGTRAESKLSLGSYDFNRRAMMNIVHKSDAGVSKLSASYYAKDNRNDYLGTGNTQNALSRYYDKSTSLFMYGSHKITTGALKGLGAGFIYSRKVGGLGEFWMGQQTLNLPINELTWEQVVPYIKYERQLSDKLSFDGYVKGNISTEKAYVGGWFNLMQTGSGATGFSAYNTRTIDKELLAELKYQLSEKTNIIGGVNTISRYGTGAPQSYAYGIYGGPGFTLQQDPSFYKRSSTYNIYSAFAQAQHNINFLKGFIITAGARLDMGRVYDAESGNVTTSYNQLSPRIAGVLKVTDQLNIKYMLGTALRAPLVKEVSVTEETKAIIAKDPNVLAANPNAANELKTLKAEKLISHEVAATYNLDKLSATATGFTNKTTDPLGKTSIVGVNGQVYANLPGNITASGFELELGVNPVKGLRISANASHALAKVNTINKTAAGTDTTVVTNTVNTPNTKVNGYITYTFNAPIKISATMVGHFIDHYRVADVNSPMLKGFNVFDFNLIGAVTENVSLELQVRNVLNSNYRTPAFYGSNMLNLPNPGRTFLGTVAFKF